MKCCQTARAVLLLLGLLLAGCQSALIAPPPSFDPPVVTPGVQQPPPPAIATAPPKPDVTNAPIVKDPLVAGPALTPKKPSRAWKYIIVHHSDSAIGSAKIFDQAHRVRGWEMLGYDFVIGNGSATPDGQVEVGPCWTWQLDGAHTGTPDRKYNEFGIGICLVGDFENTRPSPKQFDSLARLCGYMMKKYNIPARNIIGHRDAKSTKCPGRHMYSEMDRLRKLAQSYASR